MKKGEGSGNASPSPVFSPRGAYLFGRNTTGIRNKSANTPENPAEHPPPPLAGKVVGVFVGPTVGVGDPVGTTVSSQRARRPPALAVTAARPGESAVTVTVFPVVPLSVTISAAFRPPRDAE
jgi:hypothetical protein